jgi:multidrug efflux pump subunit AcrA (membrane-fusion protein)
MKRFLIISLVVLVVAGGIWWYSNSQTAQADTVTNRASVVIEQGSVISSVKATNRLAAETEVSLNFETTGTVAEIFVKEGHSFTLLRIHNYFLLALL